MLLITTARIYFLRESIWGQHEQIIVVRTDGNIERLDTMELDFPLG